MSRLTILLYGLVCYAMFLGVFLYAFAFMGGFLVPRTIDSPVGAPPWLAVVIDAALLLAFGLQHSVMARPTFKRWWTKLVPPAAERSTYVLASNVCFIALFLLWQPIPTVIWNAELPAA